VPAKGPRLQQHLRESAPRSADVSFHRVSRQCVPVPKSTAGLAASFGLIDWLAIPARTRAKRIGLLHALSNVVAILAFAVVYAPNSMSGRSPRAA
jgi:hypothetical protein